MIGDSPRAARYAGMRTRRNILLVMGLSGLLAGIGGASQDGDFRHLLDSRGLAQPGYGYTGIVVAALARYNPFAVVLVAFLIGGLATPAMPFRAPTSPPAWWGSCRASSCSARSAANCSCAIASASGAAPPWRRRPPREQQPLRPDRVVRHRLRHAAPVRRARRAAGRALGRAQPGRRGDDAGRGGDGLLRRAATGRAGADRTGRGDRRGGPRRRGDREHPRVPRDHAAREPDRLGPRDHDLRRRRRALVVPRERPQPGASRRRATSSGRSCRSRCRTCPSSGHSSSPRPRSCTRRGC